MTTEPNAAGRLLAAMRVDPLVLLNMPVEETREFFESQLRDMDAAGLLGGNTVEEQVDLAIRALATIRRIFEVLDEQARTDAPDARELRSTVAALDEFLQQITPRRTRSALALSSRGSLGRADFVQDFQPLWAAAPVWERLVDILAQTPPLGQTPSHLVCPVCGRIQERGRSDQVYCCGACRAAASRARQQ